MTSYDRAKHKQAQELHPNLPLTRAKVTCNNDPMKLGRVQVRIFSYHGLPGKTDRSIPDEDLPWAMPCFYGGTGQDLGSFLVPIPGTFVWVFFENNDIDKPVYFGGVPSFEPTTPRDVNFLGVGESPQQPWTAKAGQSDGPMDEFDGKSSGVPERGVVYKSQKGHTIMFDDTDGEESMSFIDRVGQIIKFVCGVDKGKNSEPYHRALNTAEQNNQLYEGLTEDSHILMKSGQTEEKKIHSLIKIFQERMRGESINVDTGKFTTTDYCPTEYNQQTQDSILNMTEEHISMSFPEILEYFCETHYSVTAFNKCEFMCTPDGIHLTYDGNGLFIDSDKVMLKFKNTTVTLMEETLTGKTKTEFSVQTDATSFGGSEAGLKGKGKEVSFEGSGKVYTEGGKTFMQGSEIHFKK